MVAVRLEMRVLDIGIGGMLRGVVRDLVLYGVIFGQSGNSQNRETEHSDGELLHGPNVARATADG